MTKEHPDTEPLLALVTRHTLFVLIACMLAAFIVMASPLIAFQEATRRLSRKRGKAHEW